MLEFFEQISTVLSTIVDAIVDLIENIVALIGFVVSIFGILPSFFAFMPLIVKPLVVVGLSFLAIKAVISVAK